MVGYYVISWPLSVVIRYIYISTKLFTVFLDLCRRIWLWALMMMNDVGDDVFEWAHVTFWRCSSLISMWGICLVAQVAFYFELCQFVRCRFVDSGIWFSLNNYCLVGLVINRKLMTTLKISTGNNFY